MRLSTMWQKLGVTDQWQIRCPKCQRTRDLVEIGGYRVAPRNAGLIKRSLGWCRSCRNLRMLIIEPSPVHAPD